MFNRANLVRSPKTTTVRKLRNACSRRAAAREWRVGVKKGRSNITGLPGYSHNVTLGIIFVARTPESPYNVLLYLSLMQEVFPPWGPHMPVALLGQQTWRSTRFPREPILYCELWKIRVDEMELSTFSCGQQTTDELPISKRTDSGQS